MLMQLQGRIAIRLAADGPEHMYAPEVGDEHAHKGLRHGLVQPGSPQTLRKDAEVRLGGADYNFGMLLLRGNGGNHVAQVAGDGVERVLLRLRQKEQERGRQPDGFG